MGTSVAYLRGRLERAGHTDLLAAVDSGELSTFAAAEAAGFVTRRLRPGTGSQNQARRRAWATLRALAEIPPLPPRPEARQPDPKPAAPKFSKLDNKRRRTKADKSSEPEKPPPFDPRALIA